MYTGDDFNYPSLIRSAAATRCSASSTRSRPPPAAALHALDAGDLDRYERAARADRPARAPHLRRADAVLQDGRRLPRLPQRPPAALPDGGRARERALGPAPRRAVRARRPGGAAARSGAGERAHAARARAGGGHVTEQAVSFNSMTADRCSLPEVIDACAAHGIEWIGPWRHKVAEVGVEEAARRIADAGLRVLVLVPRRVLRRRGSRRGQPARRRGGRGPGHGRTRAGLRAARDEGPRAARAMIEARHRAAAPARRRARRAARDRAAAPDDDRGALGDRQPAALAAPNPAAVNSAPPARCV